MIFLYLLLFVLFGLAVISLVCRLRNPEIHWRWNNIDTNDLVFPAGFVWGVATAAHQVEGGCDNNNWSRWERSRDAQGRPRIRGGQVAGRACDHWNRYPEDIRLMQELGVRSYRFSVEWSKIEPEMGTFDYETIEHYRTVIRTLKAAGIEPLLTLHHFTHPLWFEDLGGFTRADNLDHFQRFCSRIFTEFSDQVTWWCTLNEVEVLAAMGFFLGVFPPGEQDARLTAQVLLNLLEAHTRCYHTLKGLPHGDRARIGLVKNIFQFDPWRKWHVLDNLVSAILNKVFNTVILEFFRTGHFRLQLPGLVNLQHTNPAAPGALDFMGLNYYSHLPVRFRWNPGQFFSLEQRPDEIGTDMNYTVYAEGFYRALKTISALNLPVLVTENGIADARDDRRAEYIRRYLYALSRALREGLDVRGYYYWSLMDNFEWAEGYAMKFGLYQVNFDTQERTLRKGAAAFTRIVKRFS